MRRIILTLTLLLAAFAIPFPASADETPRVFVDGQELNFDVTPILISERVLVPMRGIFEALHLALQWDENSQTAWSGNICCTVGSTEAWANGNRIILQVPPNIIDGRVMVPLRFIAEAANCRVDFDASTNIVNILSTSSDTNIHMNSAAQLYYYNPGNSNAGIYRLSPDSMAETNLFPFPIITNNDILLDGNYIYFKGAKYGDRQAYLVRILKSGGTPEYFALKGDLFWFTDVSGDDAYGMDYDQNKIIKYNFKTGQQSIIYSSGMIDRSSGLEFKLVNGYLYFWEWNGSDASLYRVRTDDSEATQIIKGLEHVESYDVSGDKVYYSSYRNGINAISLDGKDQISIVSNIGNLSDERSIKLIVSDTRIYYSVNKKENGIANGSLWSIETNGKSKTKICDSAALNLAVCNGYIFYSNFPIQKTLYAIKADGSDHLKLLSNIWGSFCVE
ncbi:MAG TPA: stalk domain-containing protein [Syntrophomonadaceae bacterium]|nr:stalk domain-containing protein [Syntrophomonadaceae bacterium]